jgi:hypothetical protein
MEAKGQSSLLGVPGTVKSCSRGDSVIEGMAADEVGAEGLSAEGPEWMATAVERSEFVVREAAVIFSRRLASTILELFIKLSKSTAKGDGAEAVRSRGLAFSGLRATRREYCLVKSANVLARGRLDVESKMEEKDQ